MSPLKLLDAYVACRNQIESYSGYNYNSVRQQRRKLAEKIETKLAWQIYDLKKGKEINYVSK